MATKLALTNQKIEWDKAEQQLGKLKLGIAITADDLKQARNNYDQLNAQISGLQVTAEVQRARAAAAEVRLQDVQNDQQQLNAHEQALKERIDDMNRLVKDAVEQLESVNSQLKHKAGVPHLPDQQAPSSDTDQTETLN